MPRDPARAAAPRRARGGARRSRCCAPGRLSLGPTIDRFEELVAERVGAPYAAAVSSGTAGLHLLARIAGHRPGRRGDHVAVLLRRRRRTASSSRARRPGLRGRRPAHAEPRSRGRSRRRSPSGRRRSSRSTCSAIPCELDEIRAICDRHGLALIEDSAEALGAEYKGRAGRLARRRRRSSASTRTSRSRPARAASS